MGEKKIWFFVANAITALRILSVPPIALCIHYGQSFTALTMLFLAVVSDYVDGWLARRFDVMSSQGAFFDALADKVLVAVLIGVLSYRGVLWLPFAVYTLAREAAIAVGALYVTRKNVYMGNQSHDEGHQNLRSATIRPLLIGKYNMALLFGVLLGGLLVDSGFDTIYMSNVLFYAQCVSMILGTYVFYCYGAHLHNALKSA